MTDALTLLVDAPSLIYRALFSTPDSITAPDGTRLQGIYRACGDFRPYRGHALAQPAVRIGGRQDRLQARDQR